MFPTEKKYFFQLNERKATEGTNAVIHSSGEAEKQEQGHVDLGLRTTSQGLLDGL